MGRLIYTGIASLDGFVADRDGHFDWSAPDPEVHAFVNDLERPVGRTLLGRRLYEVMSVWDTLDLTDEPDVIHDFAGVWRAAEKVVYSTTLTEVTTRRTRLMRHFDPEAVRAETRAAPTDVSIGGPTLAAPAIHAGIIDEFRLFATPTAVGGGTPFFPLDTRLDLSLVDEHSFASGVTYRAYRPR